MLQRAITYARVSGDDRGKDGRNLAGQLAMCHEYAVKHSYTIIAELAEDDRGASGASFELEKLNEILGLAQARAFDVLVVREVDRLSRNLAKQLIVEEWLKREGVRIEYVLGEYPDTPEGNLMKNIRATVAEFERLKIVERNVRGRRQKVEAGSVMTHGNAPYGYRLARKGNKWVLKINEKEAAVVRLIFQLYLRGDGENPPMGIIGIVRKLSELQIPTYQDLRDAESAAAGSAKKHGRKRRNFGEWSRGGVWHILTNETYTGVWHYGKRGIDVDGLRYKHDQSNMLAVKIPAIIGMDDWKETVERLAYNRENSLRSQKHKYLLGKRVYCGDCGSKMQATPNYTGKRIYFYYACKANHAYATDCKNTVTYSAIRLDSLTWEWVKGLLSDPIQLQEGLDLYKQERETEFAPFRQRLEVVNELIDSNTTQLNRLLDLFLTGDFQKEILIERKARLEETIRSLEREQATLMARLGMDVTEEVESAIKEIVAKIGVGLDFAENDFDTKRQIIDLLDVTATLQRENGEKVAYVSCMLGSEIFQLTTGGNGGTNGGKGLRLMPNSSGTGGEDKFLLWWTQVAE